MAQRLVARVREFREQLKLTQAQFAERADLDYKYYQSWEGGRKIDFRFSTLGKLARACGVEVWELLKFDTPVLTLSEHPGAYEVKRTGSSDAPRASGKTRKPRPRA